MSKLVPIEHQNQRILTTAQLAEAYGTEPIKIQQNFTNNKKRYQPSKHYFLLQGDELKSFRSNLENFEVAPNVNKLYLWTEKGALLHAKSLGTDEAWEVYEKLVDDYFTIKEIAQQITTPENIEKVKRADAMYLNAKTRQAKLIFEVAKEFAPYLSGESTQLLIAGGTEVLLGKPLLPKPQIDVVFTASEIAEEVGISANMVGRLANKHNLKTPEYGMWVLDKAKSADKQVRTFMYNVLGRQKLIEIIEAEQKQGA